MRRHAKTLAALLLMLMAAVPAHAQWYQLANQATDMIQTAIMGGFNYRGTFDVGYTAGIGDKRADMLEFSTTQGLKYSNWFYMGVGAGVDVVWTTAADNNSYREQYKQSSVMIPLYTDFRFSFGQESSTRVFIDARVGAGFWVSDKYILVGDGYINTSESFYLRPAVGVRVPLSTNSKYGLNISAHYQLLTNSRWYNPAGSRSVSLNGFGATIGFEW